MRQFWVVKRKDWSIILTKFNVYESTWCKWLIKFQSINDSIVILGVRKASTRREISQMKRD